MDDAFTGVCHRNDCVAAIHRILQLVLAAGAVMKKKTVAQIDYLSFRIYQLIMLFGFLPCGIIVSRKHGGNEQWFYAGCLAWIMGGFILGFLIAGVTDWVRGYHEIE